MSRPKATSQSFLPASRCTGGEHAACSQPRDVGVIHCYWDVLWLSWVLALSPPPACQAVCSVRMDTP